MTSWPSNSCAKQHFDELSVNESETCGLDLPQSPCGFEGNGEKSLGRVTLGVFPDHYVSEKWVWGVITHQHQKDVVGVTWVVVIVVVLRIIDCVRGHLHFVVFFSLSRFCLDHPYEGNCPAWWRLIAGLDLGHRTYTYFIVTWCSISSNIWEENLFKSPYIV